MFIETMARDRSGYVDQPIDPPLEPPHPTDGGYLVISATV